MGRPVSIQHYETSIAFGSDQSARVFQWLDDMHWNQHEHYEVVCYDGSLVFSFRDHNRAMLFKLAWHDYFLN